MTLHIMIHTVNHDLTSVFLLRLIDTVKASVINAAVCILRDLKLRDLSVPETVPADLLPVLIIDSDAIDAVTIHHHIPRNIKITYLLFHLSVQIYFTDTYSIRILITII